MQKSPCAPVAQTMIRADPDVIILVFDQGARAEVCQAVPDSNVLHLLSADTAHAFIGCNPHRPVPRLHEGADEVVDQPPRSGILNHPRGRLMVCAAAVSADPKHSGTVAKNIAYGEVRYPGKLIWARHIAANRIDARSHGPYCSIRIVRNGFVIRIRAAGKRRHADRRLAEPHEAVLGSYPDLLFLVFKDAEHCFAGQQAIATHPREALILVSKQTLPDCPDPERAVGGLIKSAHRACDSWKRLKPISNQAIQPSDGSNPDSAVFSLINRFDPALAKCAWQFVPVDAIGVESKKLRAPDPYPVFTILENRVDSQRRIGRSI